MTSPELHWPTVRAVSRYFDADPYDVQRAVECDDPNPLTSPHWCEMPTNRPYQRGLCSRRATTTVGHVRVCGQHESALISALNAWLLSPMALRDVENVLETLHYRFKTMTDEEMSLYESADFGVRLRAMLTEFIGKTSDELVSESIQRFFGASA